MQEVYRRRLDWLLPSWLEDVNAYDQSMDEDLSVVGYTIAVNIIILFLFLLFFSIYRMYSPSTFTPKVDMMPQRTPPRIPNDTLFGWIKDLYNIDDDVVIDKAGYDVLFLLRFYRLSLRVFMCQALFSWIVLLPINKSGNAVTNGNSFDVWTMTNIGQGSSLCWFHLLGIITQTLVIIYFLEKEFVIYARYRHIFLRQRHAHLRTVLVEGIPFKMRSNVTLATYLEALYPNCVLSVRMALDLRKLDDLLLERDETCANLERCLYLQKTTHERPMILPPNHLVEVDGIVYYSKKLEDLNRLVQEEQEQARMIARHEDKICSKSAVAIIENFLHVTEMGSVKRILNQKPSYLTKNHGSYGSFGNYDLTPTERTVSSEKNRMNSSPNGVGSTQPSSISLDPSIMESLDNLYEAPSPSELHNLTEESVENSQQLSADHVSSSIPSSLSSASLTTIASDSHSPNRTSSFPDSKQASNSLDNVTFTSLREASNQPQSPSPPPSQYPTNIHSDLLWWETSDLSWSEWMEALWEATSWSQRWRLFKEGRHSVESRNLSNLGRSRSEKACYSTSTFPTPRGENFDDVSEEFHSLLPSSEERNLFLSKAFVTFKTFTAATIARQVIHMQLAGHMAVSEAPEPNDVLWNNLYATRTGTFWRRLLVEALVVILNIIWIAPVTLVSFVVSEDALRSFSPFINSMCEKSEWLESLVALIQPGTLVALMNLLPPILNALAGLEGWTAFSTAQFRSFDRYFFFQMVNVFLVTTIAGSFLDCIRDLYSDPPSAFMLLGTSLPKMSAFFMNYLIVKAFAGLGMEMIRMAAFFSAALKILFTSNLTPRERWATPLFGGIRSMFNPGWFPFAKIYAQDMLLFIVSATFSCIAPLILGGSLAYFAGAALVYKHQTLYVYEPVYETGGKWWPKMAKCIVVGLAIAQATMVGLLILKESYEPAYCLGAALIITIFYYYHLSKMYTPLAAQLPFDMATSMDLEARDYEQDLKGAREYIQPALRAHSLSPRVEFEVPSLSGRNVDQSKDALKDSLASV